MRDMKCRLCDEPKYNSYALCKRHHFKRKYEREQRTVKVQKEIDKQRGLSSCKVQKKSEEDSIDLWNINNDAIYC